MWVYLDSWMVQDGEIPELRVHDTFRGVALRAACLSLHEVEPDAREGIVAPRDTDPISGRNTYAVTGAVESRGRNQLVLTVHGRHYLAEPAELREVPGKSPSEHMLERYSPGFDVPPVGSRVTAVCTWEVLARYETCLQRLPADWRVRGLRVERRATNPVELLKSRILRVDTVDRLHRWSDERDGERVTYVLDLEPVTSRESLSERFPPV